MKINYFSFRIFKGKVRFFKKAWKLCLILSLFTLWFTSCRHIDCPRCEKDNDYASQLLPERVTLYNVEFNQDINLNIISKFKDNRYRINSMKSYLEPVVDINSEGKAILIIYEIEENNIFEIYDKIKKEFKQDINFYKHEIVLKSLTMEQVMNCETEVENIDEIELITSMSDPLLPPVVIPVIKCNKEQPCDCCPRDRECIREVTGFIDKLEFRLMGGYRFGTKDGIYYPDENKIYEKETFGFERGGTDITVGLEVAAFWNANSIPIALGFNKSNFKRNNFALGIMTGVWPVDGSIFIPLSFHPRYTFNYDKTDKYKGECDTWYVFGDLGIPIDPTFNVPIYCDNGKCDNQFAYFYGIGVGRDWWISECTDFSIDIAYRLTKMPLPANKCCGLEESNPFRTSDGIFLRLGLTW